VRLAWRLAFLIGMAVASRAETLLALEPSPVRVGIRNDLKIRVLVIGLTPGAGASIRLVPGETVWERLPAQSRRPVIVRDAQTGRVLLQTLIFVPDQGPVLYSLQFRPGAPGPMLLPTNPQ
jgi:hypothetical protein